MHSQRQTHTPASMPDHPTTITAAPHRVRTTRAVADTRRALSLAEA